MTTLPYDTLSPYDTPYTFDGYPTWADVCIPYGDWTHSPATLGETDGTDTWGDDGCE